MATPSHSLLRRVFGEICRGYSSVDYHEKRVYVKHLTDFEQSEADQFYEKHLNRAAKNGIYTREDKEKWLCGNGLWSEKQEIEIKRQEEYLKALNLGLTKAAFKSQIDAQKKTIAEEEKRYYEMLGKREKMFGLTAEHYAQNKVQFYYIYLSFYRDEKLRKRVYSIEEIDQLDDDESSDLLEFYVGFVQDFSSDNIRRIAVSPYFQNSFYLCGENLSQFFGKPMVELTSFQSNLLSMGFYFKNIMSGESIPPEIRDNPDKIEEFINQSAAMKERISKMSQTGGSTGLINASKEDFKVIGAEDDRSFLRKETNLMKELNLG